MPTFTPSTRDPDDPLDVRVESRDTTATDWITERVSFTAAYGGERMSAFLFTPKRGIPPYPLVLHFPVETSQEPFFRRLGTREADKRYVLYSGGHVLPRTQLIAESLAWLDKYLGPVR